MEMILRDKKAELCFNHDEGSIGFIVILDANSQLDFLTDLDGWEQLKTFIDDSIYKYKQELKAQNKAKE